MLILIKKKKTHSSQSLILITGPLPLSYCTWIWKLRGTENDRSDGERTLSSGVVRCCPGLHQPRDQWTKKIAETSSGDLLVQTDMVSHWSPAFWSRDQREPMGMLLSCLYIWEPWQGWSSDRLASTPGLEPQSRISVSSWILGLRQ